MNKSTSHDHKTAEHTTYGKTPSAADAMWPSAATSGGAAYCACAPISGENAETQQAAQPSKRA